ncbi:MAG: DnaJ C-terminal domain-containing protein [Oligoflexales bacterium]
MSNYYKVLGVEKSASDADIKKAFRKLAMQYHPDRNQGDKQAEDKFKEVNEAYAVLSDPEKRKQYDMFGEQGFHQRYSTEDIFRGFDFSSIFDEFGLGGDRNNIFSHIFGAGFAGGQPRGGFGGPERGQDVSYPLEIGFMEAYNGGERKISFSLSNGSKRDLTVKIPAGINTGGRLRVSGKGAESRRGGQAGDLYIDIKVAPHPHFVREGNDIVATLPLKISEAFLGTSKEVETPIGIKKIKVPESVKPGTKIRLKGLGFPVSPGNTTRGDMFAVAQIEVPDGKLSGKQKEAITLLREVGL